MNRQPHQKSPARLSRFNTTNADRQQIFPASFINKRRFDRKREFVQPSQRHDEFAGLRRTDNIFAKIIAPESHVYDQAQPFAPSVYGCHHKRF
jgi:hypothetical protein